MPSSYHATLALDLLSVPYRLFEHVHIPASIEQAASERGQAPNQVIRSLLFRLELGNYFLVLMAGPGQVSWRKLRAYLGVRRISMATREEVSAVTGYAVGTVSPFGLFRPLRILADRSVFLPEEVSLGSGVLGVAIIMKTADLRLALEQIESGQFC